MQAFAEAPKRRRAVQGSELDVSDLRLAREDEVLAELAAGQAEGPAGRKRPITRKTAEGVVKPVTVELLDTYRKHLDKFIAERERERQLAAQALGSVAAGLRAAPGKGHPQRRSSTEESAWHSTDGPAHGGATGAAQEALVRPQEALIHVAVEVPGAGGLVSEEWLLLGSQTLRDLRRCIFCLSDVNAKALEDAENGRLDRARAASGAREASPHQPVKLVQPASYFYIEGTFYTSGEAPDLSEPVLKHLRSLGVRAPEHPLPEFTQPPRLATQEYSTASLDTPLAAVWLRAGPGRQGVFCHQGGCEHIVTVRDVRRFDPNCDPAWATAYPLQVAGLSFLQQRPCGACGAAPCALVTYEDRVATSSPFFWCDACFRELHYDARGRARFTDFKVFPYSMENHAFVAQRHGGSFGTRQHRGSGGARL